MVAVEDSEFSISEFPINSEFPMDDTSNDKTVPSLDLLEIQIYNMEAFIQNGSIKILEYDRSLTSEEIKFLQDMADIQYIPNSPTTDPGSPASYTGSDNSSVFEKLVREIRDGNDITIITPSPTNSDFSEFDNTINQPESSQLLDTKPILSKSLDDLAFEKGESSKSKDNMDIKATKSIILITRPIKDGEPPLPLPSWTHVSEAPSNFDEAEKRALWEKELVEKKFWQRKLAPLGDNWQEIISNNEIHKISSGKGKEKESLTHNEDVSSEESFGLDLFFDEQYHKNLEKEESNLFERDEDLCLEKLFKDTDVEYTEVENKTKYKANELDLSKSKHSDLEKSTQESFINSLTPEIKSSIQ